MANAFYTSFRNRLAGSGALPAVDFDGDTIKLILVDTGAYTFSAAHTNLSQIPAGARIATQTLAGVTIGTVGPGVVDGSDMTFGSVSGASVEAVVIYKDAGGAESGNPLIAYIDTATGLPVTPNGGNIDLVLSASGLISF